MQNMSYNNAHPHFHPDLTGNALQVYARGYSITLIKFYNDYNSFIFAGIFYMHQVQLIIMLRQPSQQYEMHMIITTKTKHIKIFSSLKYKSP